MIYSGVCVLAFTVESYVSYEETKFAAMKRDNQVLVIVLIDHINSKIINPFDISLQPSPLVNKDTSL